MIHRHNHATPLIVTVSKKYWDQLSAAERKVLADAAKASRDFERKDTRCRNDKALAESRARHADQPAEPRRGHRMREKLTTVNAGIASNVGEDRGKRPRLRWRRRAASKPAWRQQRACWPALLAHQMMFIKHHLM